jgi:hypothetical protein
MARYALYGSLNSNKATSTQRKGGSNAYAVTSQSNQFSNVKKPLAVASLDDKSKKSTPSNVYMDYSLSGENFSTVRAKLARSLNFMETGSAQSTFDKYVKYYNRFKLPTLSDAFQKGFAHVFFIRPDCNILDDDGKSLNSAFEADPEFFYSWKNNKNLVKQLSLDNGQSHDFMLSLSNKAASFSLSDEYINAETYGKSFKGWQIAYGRNNVESKTAGDFSITYNDDRTLHIYQLHRLWVDYISEVYQGRKAPKTYNIKNKILDYASACYYLITAEDGETIIFWTKYYGVFPTTIPSNQYGWASGNIIEKPQVEIKYQYSFKEDMNPEALVEFNINAGVKGNMTYVPTYDSKLGHVGTTWVGAPYIELVTDNTDPECPYTFKLRFRGASQTLERG